MVKTNKFVYVYKVEWDNKINLNLLKEKFVQDKKYENFLREPKKDYRYSLVYHYTIEGISFFSLIKGKESNIAVLDFNSKEDAPHYLDENKKLKNHNLLAFVEEKNLLLILFNHESFGHGIGQLSNYLETVFGCSFNCEIITKDQSDEELKRLLSGAKHIHVKRSRRDYKQFEILEKGSSKQKIKKYLETKEEIIKIGRVHEIPPNILLNLVKKFKIEEPDKIIIGHKN